MANLRIQVNPKILVPPTVDAGPDQQLILPTNSINITAIATDDESIDSYSWIKTIGPAATLSGQTTDTLSVTDMVEGSYTFEITVTDNDGQDTSDTVVVNVVVANQSPVADAGDDIVLDNSVYSGILNTNYDVTDLGSGDFRFNLDPDRAQLLKSIFDSGGITGMTLRVRKLVGADTLFHSATVVSIEDMGGVATGIVVINFTDGYDPTDVPVPVSDATQTGLLFTFTRTHIVLDGSGSYDPDGTISGYQWTNVSGPTLPTLSTPSSVATFARFLTLQGNYEFQLEVEDNGGVTATDNIVVTTNDGLAQNPPQFLAFGEMIDSDTDVIGVISEGASLDVNGHPLNWTIPVNIIDIDGPTHQVDINFKIRRGPVILFESNQSTPTLSASAHTFNMVISSVLNWKIGEEAFPAPFVAEVTLTDEDGETDYRAINFSLFDSSLGTTPASIQVLSTNVYTCYSQRVIRITPPVGEERTIEFLLSSGLASITPAAGVINSQTDYTMRVDGSNVGVASQSDTATIRIKRDGFLENTNTLMREHTGNIC
jgi:hypothetical protein